MAGMELSFVSLHTIGLEVGNRLLHVLDIEGTPVMRVWNVVRLHSKVLSPAAEAFRYSMLEHGEAHLLAHDAPLLNPAKGSDRDAGPSATFLARITSRRSAASGTARRCLRRAAIRRREC